MTPNCTAPSESRHLLGPMNTLGPFRPTLFNDACIMLMHSNMLWMVLGTLGDAAVPLGHLPGSDTNLPEPVCPLSPHCSWHVLHSKASLPTPKGNELLWRSQCLEPCQPTLLPPRNTLSSRPPARLLAFDVVRRLEAAHASVPLRGGLFFSTGPWRGALSKPGELSIDSLMLRWYKLAL